MNKRILMLIGIIFCVFIRFVNPMNVSAVEYVDGKGFIVHNVYGKGGDESPDDNPQTGDNIFLYLIGLSISIIGFVSGKQYLKHNN